MHREGQQLTIRFRKSAAKSYSRYQCIPSLLGNLLQTPPPSSGARKSAAAICKRLPKRGLSIRPSGLELTHCSSPPPFHPLQDKSTFIGAFKTKPPHLSEVYEVSCCFHSALCPLHCFSRVELHCIRCPRPPIPDRTLRRGLHAWPMWLAPKSCAANQCPHCSAAGQASH